MPFQYFTAEEFYNEYSGQPISNVTRLIPRIESNGYKIAVDSNGIITGLIPSSNETPEIAMPSVITTLRDLDIRL